MHMKAYVDFSLKDDTASGLLAEVNSTHEWDGIILRIQAHVVLSQISYITFALSNWCKAGE